MPPSGTKAPNIIPNLHLENSRTPPPSPTSFHFKDNVTIEVLQKTLVETIKAVQNSSASAGPHAFTTDSMEPSIAKTPRERASRLEVKSVVEVWNSKIHEYRLEESSPADDVSELEEYVFIVRIRINKDTQNRVHYVDINCKDLREILRTVFSDVNNGNLRQDKPSIERDLLYQYLPELEYCLARPTSYESTTTNKLQVLIRYISKSYTVISQRLTTLLEHGEISYDLLPSLFKPNDPVYTTCFGTGKPRCVKYDAGEEKTKSNGEKFYRLDCRYFDFDGKIVGEVSTSIDIPKFRGYVLINRLSAFPLPYHSASSRIRAELIDCGRKFLSWCGTYHRHCCGNAFVINKDKLVKVSVDSRVMIDASFFREMNPNYARRKVDGNSSAVGCIDFFGGSSISTESTDKVRYADLEANELELADLLFCCPTVPGFSFTDKLWCKNFREDICLNLIKNVN